MYLMSFRFPFTRETLVELPKGSRILNLTYDQISGPVLTAPELAVVAWVWVLTEEGAELGKRRFLRARSGDELPNAFAPLVGTVELKIEGQSSHVYQVFDMGEVES